MTRVNRRPVALLDGAPEAARLVEPGSDAERYFDRNTVVEKIKGFAGSVAMLGDAKLPRAPGPTRLVNVEGQRLVAIQGEDVTPEGGPAMYGFGFGPDGGEHIGVSRIAGDKGRRLAWVDYQSEGDLVFRAPDDPARIIEDEAQVSELTQILAAGEDAAEWALH